MAELKGLKRWFKEKWITPDGEECGSSSKKGIKPKKCRPSVKVTKKTPKTWGELSESEKKKAIADKNKANAKGEQFGKVRFSRLRKAIDK